MRLNRPSLIAMLVLTLGFLGNSHAETAPKRPNILLVVARADGPTSGQERRARGRTLRLDVKVLEQQAFARELVETGCRRSPQFPTAVDTELAPP